MATGEERGGSKRKTMSQNLIERRIQRRGKRRKSEKRKKLHKNGDIGEDCIGICQSRK